MKRLVHTPESDDSIIMSMRITVEQRKALQKAWQKTGEYRNRTEWVKAALNAFAGEDIFL